MATPGSSKVCKLKRCQGKRGCLCPKLQSNHPARIFVGVIPAALASAAAGITADPHSPRALSARHALRDGSLPRGKSAASAAPVSHRPASVEVRGGHAEAVTKRRAQRSKSSSTAPTKSTAAGGTQARSTKTTAADRSKRAGAKGAASRKPKPSTPDNIAKSTTPAPREPSTGVSSPLLLAGGDGDSDAAVAELSADVPTPPSGAPGRVIIRYNHYREEVELGEGNSLGVRQVKDMFSFDYGFRGSYKVHLRATEEGAGGAGRLCRGDSDRIGGLANAEPPAVYYVEIEEDPEEVARALAQPHKAYTAPIVSSVNTASRDLTKQLKGLSAAELKSQSARYQELVEARDLEDVLFSGDGLMGHLADRNDPSVGNGSGADDVPASRDSPDSLDNEGAFEGSSDGDGDDTDNDI